MGPEISRKSFPLPRPAEKFALTRHMIFLQSQAVITTEGIFKNNLHTLKILVGAYKKK